MRAHGSREPASVHATVSMIATLAQWMASAGRLS
jgi:hypothetical protein